jgi:hypothetical protein
LYIFHLHLVDADLIDKDRKRRRRRITTIART